MRRKHFDSKEVDARCDGPHGELVFWDVRKAGKTIIATLGNERYKKLIVEVVDLEGTVQRVRGAMGNP